MDDKTNNERGITMLPMSAIEINNGQLKGLPKNPRLVKNAKYDKLKWKYALSSDERIGTQGSSCFHHPQRNAD